MFFELSGPRLAPVAVSEGINKDAQRLAPILFAKHFENLVSFGYGVQFTR